MLPFHPDQDPPRHDASRTEAWLYPSVVSLLLLLAAPLLEGVWTFVAVILAAALLAGAVVIAVRQERRARRG